MGAGSPPSGSLSRPARFVDYMYWINWFATSGDGNAVTPKADSLANRSGNRDMEDGGRGCDGRER